MAVGVLLIDITTSEVLTEVAIATSWLDAVVSSVVVGVEEIGTAGTTGCMTVGWITEVTISGLRVSVLIGWTGKRLAGLPPEPPPPGASWIADVD